MEDKILGDYKVLKQLRETEKGGVFLAEHRFIKKPFILKVLSGKEAGEEAGYLVSLDHPHLVKVQTVSCSEDIYFLVTDCLHEGMEGVVTLETYLASHKLTEEEVLAVLRQVASVLDYVHGRVSHKPLMHKHLNLNTLLVVSTEPTLTLSLCDLGTPPQTSACFASHAHYAFLSPEQKRGEALTATTDSYAFGTLCYYLLTGRFPEGLFEMPSALVPTLRFDWDKVIKETLSSRSEKRREMLMPLLEEIVQPQLRSTSKEELKKEGSVALEAVAAAVTLKTPVVEEKILVHSFAEKAQTTVKKTESTVIEYTPEKIDKTAFKPLPAEMVLIEGGEFMRGSMEGSRDEMPRHKVLVSPFVLDIHPITNEQYCRFLEFVGGEKDENHDLIRLKDSRMNRSAGKLSIETGYSKHPVVGVTWYGAFAYAQWVGKRLPTEAEWEIAAMGGKTGPFPSGDTIDKTQANFFSSDTTAVKSYQPNGYGIYDMAGNVYEWCQDWYGYNYYEVSASDPRNPKGPPQGVYRVLRGGCWKSLKEDLRCSHRHRNNPGALNGTYGFRCASDV